MSSDLPRAAASKAAGDHVSAPAEYEAAIIGAALACPDDAMRIIALGVQPDSFYVPHHRAIWSALIRSRTKSLLEVKNLLDAEKHEAADSLYRFVDSACLTSEIQWHVGSVLEAGRRRALRELGLKIAENAEDGDLATMLEAARKELEVLDGHAFNVDRYTVRSWSEISTMSLKPRGWFWGECFALGQLQTIIGQGGLGKSRMALNLVRNQVLGLPFGGLPTGQKPLAHLMMGSENSIHRLQYDIQRMSRGLSEDQRRLLGGRIFLATIENPDDGYISLDSEMNVKRWKSTVQSVKPDVLWVDPYGDIHAGDANSDSDTRYTIGMLSRLVRAVNPEAGIVILHHARTGSSNIAQAVGFDAANFGKNSKALFSSCRSVVNLAPFDKSDNPPILCANAKNNNARRFEPFKLVLDEDSMTYSHESVDVEAWQNEVMAGCKVKKTARASAPLETYHEAVVDILREGPLPSGTLHEKIKHTVNKGDKYVAALVNDCVFRGRISKTPRLKEKDGKVLYGTPDQVAAIIKPPLG